MFILFDYAMNVNKMKLFSNVNTRVCHEVIYVLCVVPVLVVAQ